MNLNFDGIKHEGTACYSMAGLGIGSTASQISIAAPNGAGVDYSINGIMYHKADVASAAITAAAAQAVSTSCLYLICLNAAGTVSSVKGVEVPTADITQGLKQLQYPMPVVNTCPIGAVRVDTDGSTTFTAGTTLLSAAGITDTYINLGTIPARGLQV